MTSTTTSTAGAQLQEEVLAQWRDWRCFLDAQQTLLAARLADDQAQFELTDADVRAATAQQSLRAIPPARRHRFEAELEARRRTTQHALDRQYRAQGQHTTADPDAVERDALTSLRTECEGGNDGRGLVPAETSGQWWSLDVEELLDTPVAAYTIKGTTAPQQRLVALTGIGGIVVAVVAALFLFWPRPAAPQAIRSDVPLVNGAVALPIHPTALLLHRGTETQTVTLETVPPASPWPPRAAVGETGLVWEASVWPLQVCVPGDLTGLTGLTLRAPGLPERQYTLREAAAGADLVLTVCHTPAQPRYAVIRATVSPPALTVGEAVAWSGGMLTLETVTLVGPGHDPLLPTDQARVRLVVALDTDEGVDWPSLAPTLLLQNGDKVLPEQIDDLTEAGAPRRARLTYLVPRPTAPQQMAWQITDGATVHRWRVTLPVPPTRTAVLHTLEVTNLQVEAVRGLQPGTIVLTASWTLHNPLAVPVMVQPQDITLVQGGQPLTLPDLDLFHAPLSADHRQPVAFTLSVMSGDLTLTVGSLRTTVTIQDTAQEGGASDNHS